MCALINNQVEAHTVDLAAGMPSGSAREGDVDDGGSLKRAGAAKSAGHRATFRPGTAPVTRVHTLALPGHRGDVRAVALSGDDGTLASTSNRLVKFWTTAPSYRPSDADGVPTGPPQCIRTAMTSTFALCCAFVPGGKRLVVGTKCGALQLFDVASARLVCEVVNAHDGAVWGLAVRPDERGFVTGSADHSAKFWEFGNHVDVGSSDDNSGAEGGNGENLGTDVAANDGVGTTDPSGGGPALVHVRTLRMAEDVLAVSYSHSKARDRLLVAVALLDSTVKVFFEDSLKFFLSLYGHKLPVLSLDISTDDTLCVTASADKNIKLWGLDFGDCHKSMFAHADSVMAVRFVPQTHMFFSIGKDGLVKYWDGDKFEQVLALKGHRGEAWCLAVAHGHVAVLRSLVPLFAFVCVCACCGG